MAAQFKVFSACWLVLPKPDDPLTLYEECGKKSSFITVYGSWEFPHSCYLSQNLCRSDSLNLMQPAISGTRHSSCDVTWHNVFFGVVLRQHKGWDRWRWVVHLKVQTAWSSLGSALKSPWLSHFCPLALYSTHFRRGRFFSKSGQTIACWKPWLFCYTGR